MATLEELLVNISDVRVLKAKRAARKGNLTRLANHLERIKGVEIESLRPAEINRKMDALTENMSEYNLIQERLCEVCEEGAAEEEAAEDQRDATSALLDAYQTLFDVAQAWADGGRLEDDASDLVLTKDLSGSYARKSYEYLLSTFKTFRQTLKSLPRDESLLAVQRRLEPIMMDLGERIDRDVRSSEDSSASSHEPTDPVASAPRIHHSKLKLELPKFSGDLLHWKDFWDLFSAVIETEHLSDREKICHLQTSMRSDEAKSVVRHAASKGSYDEVVQALKKRYDKHRIVYMHHVAALKARAPVRHSADDLIRCMQEIDLHHSGLSSTGGDTLSQYLAASTVLLMDSTCASHWSDYTSKTESPPGLDTLRGFCEHRLTALQSNPNVKKSYKPPGVSNQQQSSKPKERAKSTVYHVRGIREGFRDTCPICDEEHSVYQCPTFKGWNVGRRLSAAKEKRLCINCLGRGHSLETCHSKHTCRDCSGRHHSLLHRQQDAPPAATGPSAPANGQTNCARAAHSQGPPTLTFPRTAMALVTAGPYQHTGRAMLDPGSTVTLITSRLANTLKARKRRSTVQISGLTGGTTTSHEVEIGVGSMFDLEDNEIRIVAQVIDTITADCPVQDLGDIQTMPFLDGLKLADPTLGTPGRIDLLGVTDCNRCMEDGQSFSDDKLLVAQKTIFGWAVGGSTTGTNSSRSCYVTSASDKTADEMIQLFWEMERVPGESVHFTFEEQAAISNFQDTHTRDEDGRYRVQLPRKEPTPVLGVSRVAAKRRLQQNKRSLIRKEKWSDFTQAVVEYPDLGHAELVPPNDLQKDPSKTFYLPMHGVVKEASETTKLRIVFDASAKSSTGVSLNDTLLKGPSLYPLLTSVLNRFRCHAVGIAADISKMFREVGLQEGEKDYHRFLMETDDGVLVELRMTRLTFGIAPSPFLATQVLLQLAKDYCTSYPAAARAIRNDFYVDDLLSGAPDAASAQELRIEVTQLLSHGCMLIRKWLSNSDEFMQAISPELRARDESSFSISPVNCTKTLGVHWNTASDTLHISTPTLDDVAWPTKRQVASAVARTFDVHGWFSPATVIIKILLQKVWQAHINWDDPIPKELLTTWTSWREQLSSLTDHPIPRYVADGSSPVIDRQLHGFCDASTVAYGGVVYLRLLHADTTTSVRLMTSKTRVAPLSGLTIPRLELCGALLLAKLLQATAKDLNILLDHVYAWCDSSVVLGWLNRSPSSLLVFVANRVGEVCSRIPANQWRYVATHQNPADYASRGLLPQELLWKDIWWNGPPWLSLSPEEWPRRPDINLDRELPDIKAVVLLAQPKEFPLWQRFSSHDKLLRTVAWCVRFIHNCRKKVREKSPHPDPTPAVLQTRLTPDELEDTRLVLLKCSQQQSFPDAVKSLKTGEQLSTNDPLLALRPLLGEDGLLRVGGRLDHSGLEYRSRHPIILDRRSWLTRLLVRQVHLLSNHAGPTTMLAILSEKYYVKGIKRLTKALSRSCVTCRKAYAKTASQLMGQLPAARVRPSPPFSAVGLDFAGPFSCKRGNPRKPTITKAYACIYVCFSTKAVHIELVSELSTAAFLASFQRFVACRGCPSEVYSDNGSNFRGAWREIKEVQDLLAREDVRGSIHHYTSERNIKWSFSPSRAPHFGGLWEASVKLMKGVLKKTIGEHRLTFEELATLLTEAEATINSRPLLPSDSMSEDGVPVLTPGHFLIGRPLRAVPLPADSISAISNLRRWNLTQRLRTDLWNQWSKQYLRELQRRSKWLKPQDNLCVGDLVMIKDAEFGRHTWPVGIIAKVYPGIDSLVRAADERIDGKVYSRPIAKMVVLISEDGRTPHPFPGEDVRASRDPSPAAEQ